MGVTASEMALMKATLMAKLLKVVIFAMFLLLYWTDLTELWPSSLRTPCISCYLSGYDFVLDNNTCCRLQCQV